MHLGFVFLLKLLQMKLAWKEKKIIFAFVSHRLDAIAIRTGLSIPFAPEEISSFVVTLNFLQ